MKQFCAMTEPEIRQVMIDAANSIKHHLPDAELFTLITFSADQIGQYISNAMRPDMIKALREFADRLEARDDVTRTS
jgi:hypothetical protein